MVSLQRQDKSCFTWTGSTSLIWNHYLSSFLFLYFREIMFPLSKVNRSMHSLNSTFEDLALNSIHTFILWHLLLPFLWHIHFLPPSYVPVPALTVFLPTLPTNSHLETPNQKVLSQIYLLFFPPVSYLSFFTPSAPWNSGGAVQCSTNHDLRQGWSGGPQKHCAQIYNSIQL